MDTSKLYSLRTEIVRRLVDCDDTDLLLNIYEKITGETYPEDQELLLKEAEVEYKTIENSQRVPGLPYTHEERMEALKKAENEESISHEEAMKILSKWF